MWIARLAMSSLVFAGVGRHVRRGGVRLQRIHAFPLLDHHEGVRAVAWSGTERRVGIDGGAVLDAALLGAHGRHVGAEVREDAVALAGLGGDDGDDVDHAGSLCCDGLAEALTIPAPAAHPCRRRNQPCTSIHASRMRRRSLLAGGAATLLLPKLAFGQAKPTVRIGVPTKTYFPTIIAETAIRQKLFDKEGIDCRADDLPQRRRGLRGARRRRRRPGLQLLLQRRRGPGEGREVEVRRQRRPGLLRLAHDGEAGFADQETLRARGQEGRHHLGRLRLRHPRALDDGRPEDRVHARPAGRRWAGAQPADRQRRRHRALFAAHLPGDAGQAGALDRRFRRTGAAALDRLLDRHRQDHRRARRRCCRRR